MGGVVEVGWGSAVATLPSAPIILALDGPAWLDWEAAVDGLLAGWRRLGVSATRTSMLGTFLPWDEILRRTASPELEDDPDFDTLASGNLADLLIPPRIGDDRPSHWIVYGPGAALVKHDVLWYADLPKRFAEEAVAERGAANLGQPADRGPGTAKRLFYIDWPLLDRHRDTISSGIDRWLDLRDVTGPASISGPVLRRTTAKLAGHPFRTQPTFNTAPWGGHWGQRALGHNPGAPNTALGYELIAPESGILIGDAAATVELPFSLVVAQHPQAILGSAVHEAFGTSFPIRFDYLDTVGGGNLSVHCHPQEDYMRKVFGWSYTQHETYYVVAGSSGSQVFLGLRDRADVDAFEREARAADREGRPFDIEQHVQVFPATPGQLFMIPAGTPHGSGEGNVILEVSATPYLYSLRFYDWLRRDDAGQQRPVHVDHAFRNLDPERSGDRVRSKLIQQPERIRTGDGWYEERLGQLPECFFEVRRVILDTDAGVPDDTAGRFHVLNVVDGAAIEVETAAGYRHLLHQAETLLIPAACGAYRIRRRDGQHTRVVKAAVR